MLIVFQGIFRCLVFDVLVVVVVYSFPCCILQVTVSCVSTIQCMDLCVAYYCVAVTPTLHSSE